MVEINVVENRKTTEKINKIQSWFYDKVNKINKPLARVTNKRRELSATINPQVLINMYPTTAEYMLFSTRHGT